MLHHGHNRELIHKPGAGSLSRAMGQVCYRLLLEVVPVVANERGNYKRSWEAS